MGSHFYDWRYGRVHYRKSGLGDPLVLVHDLYGGASCEEFDHNVRALSCNYRVYALDLLGFGDSDAPCMRYRADLYPLLLREFIEDVVQSPVDAIASGASGAYLAEVAADQPDLVRKLVFISPYDRAPESARRVWPGKILRETFRLLLISPPLKFAFEKVMSGEWELNEMLRRLFHDARRIDGALVERLSELARKPRAIYACASLEAGLLFASFRKVLPRVKNPTLFICGREVESELSQGLTQLAQITPQSRIEWVSGAARWVHHEMAFKTNRLIASFLEELQSADQARSLVG